MVSERLNRLCISLLVVAGFLIGFTGYCAALIHWVKTISDNNLSYNPAQAILETAILLLYTCLGIRFCHKKINLF